MKNVTESSIRLYRWLARSFPEDFLRNHGRDMVQLSEDLIRQEAVRGGLRGFLPLLLRLLLDLIWRSVVEHAIALRQDFFYGLRMLRRTPALTILCAASLAIGIGMSTSSYQQMRTFYFQSTPGVGDASGLVRLESRTSYPNYEAFRDHSGKFSGVAAFLAPVPFLFNADAHVQRVWGHLVTPNYFDVLHARMSLGRGFRADAFHRNGSPEVIVSHRFFENQLGANRALLGHDLNLNGHAVTLAGVATDGFLGASPLGEVADLWIPLTSQSAVAPELASHPLEDRRIATFEVVGRLKPGVTMSDAEAALDALVRRLEEQNRDPGRERKGRRVTLIPGGRLIPISDRDRATASSFPIVLNGLLLWVACANVATLLLARAAGRRKEVAVRLAMGASRWRIVRQLLTESTLLSLLGAAAGFLVVHWSNSSMDWVRPVLPEYIQFHSEMDWTVVLFALAVGVGTGIVFGLAPALHATRQDIAPALKDGTALRLPGFRWFGMRNLFVLQQLSASLMLLLLAGFIMIGMQRAATPDLGFDTHHLYRMSIDPVREGYSAAAAPELLRKVLDRVRSQPGVESASLSLSAPMEPFGGAASMTRLKQDEKQTSPDKRPLGAANLVNLVEATRIGSGFFETAKIPVVAGRAFEDGNPSDANTVMVNETLAKGVYPGKNPVGQILELDDQRLEIIGVVKDLRSNFLFNLAQKRAYRPLDADTLGKPGPRGVVLMVRMDPGVVPDTLVRQAVSSLDPNLTVFDISSMDNRVADMLSVVRMTMTMYGAIGMFCLVLAVTGLAGVTAYAVAQRKHEIGIRMALGAGHRDILRLVMKEGTVLVLLGTTLGVASSLAMLRVLSGILDAIASVTSTSISDPRIVIGAPLLMAAIAMLACYLPARRSMRVDPVDALRQE
jgi:predicted permease